MFFLIAQIPHVVGVSNVLKSDGQHFFLISFWCITLPQIYSN